MSHDDFEVEPIPGVPARLPEGERIIWQGAPSAWNLAIRALHVRKVAIYFLALMAWRFSSSLDGGQPAATAAGYALGLLPFMVAAMAILGFIARGYARTTIYTLTNRRILIRSGIALPITMNLPLSHIDSAALKSYADGSGDIAIAVRKSERVAAFAVWPHLRPWSWTRPQPMFRGVRDAALVSSRLATALQGHAVTIRPAYDAAPTATANPGAAAHA